MDDPVNKTESCIGIAILSVLLGIAVWLFIKQAHYDPNLFTASFSQKSAAPAVNVLAGSSLNLESLLPAGMESLTALETFGPETLSEKIDGKAELYLSSGFHRLWCQRLQKSGRPNSWMELFIFDMGKMRNAFSVYSVQRRSDARDAGVTRFSYGTPNALFLVHGRYYVEIIGSDESLSREMLAVAENFIERHPAESGDLKEITFFPSDHLELNSITLHPVDLFGFSRFNNAFTATYNIAGTTLTAFLSLRESTREAAVLAEDYLKFLIANGATLVPARLNIPGGKIVRIFDSFELVFTCGRWLAGVHEAGDAESAGKLGLMLYNKLQKAPK